MITVKAQEKCGAVYYFKCDNHNAAMLLIQWLKFAMGTDTVEIL